MNTKTDLSEEEIMFIEQAENQCKDLGLESVTRKVIMKEIKLPDDKLFKFNLPDTPEGFESGNGEGVWGIAFSDEDHKKFESEKSGTYKVILLNNSIYYPFPYGSVLTVQNRGSKRPVLDFDWLDEVIKNSSNGEMDLLSYISEE